MTRRAARWFASTALDRRTTAAREPRSRAMAVSTGDRPNNDSAPLQMAALDDRSLCGQIGAKPGQVQHRYGDLRPQRCSKATGRPDMGGQFGDADRPFERDTGMEQCLCHAGIRGRYGQRRLGATDVRPTGPQIGSLPRPFGLGR